MEKSGYRSMYVLIDGGFKPRAMTRDLDWGVKVPLPEGEGKFFMFGLMHQ